MEGQRWRGAWKGRVLEHGEVGPSPFLGKLRRGNSLEEWDQRRRAAESPGGKVVSRGKKVSVEKNVGKNGKVE